MEIDVELGEELHARFEAHATAHNLSRELLAERLILLGLERVEQDP